MTASLLMIGAMLVAQVPAGDGNALKVEIRTLVRQLNSASLAERNTAEEKLIQKGPRALALLPEPTDDIPPEVRDRLARICQRLQQIEAESFTRPPPITLHSPAMPLAKVLAALQEQSGNRIIDTRRRAGLTPPDPELKVDFDRTPFWRALDEVLDEAGLSVYPFGQQHALCIVPRSPGQLPRTGRASYSGPFRFEPIRILAGRNLRESAGGTLTLVVEVAWEPRLRPMGLKQRMAEAMAVDENGAPLPVEDRKAVVESLAQSDATAVDLELPLALPPRGVREIARFDGRLRAMAPGKIETFSFRDLLAARNVVQRIAGATVTLEQVRKNNDLWEAHVRVRFDEAGNSLETHRGWILQNEADLVGPKGQKLPYSSQEITHQSENEIGLTYSFPLKESPRAWKFVYKTPGVIVTASFPYEFQGIKLP